MFMSWVAAKCLRAPQKHKPAAACVALAEAFGEMTSAPLKFVGIGETAAVPLKFAEVRSETAVALP